LPITSGTLATPYVYALDLGTFFTGHCLPSLHVVIMSKPDDRVAEIIDASRAGAHAAEEPSFPAAETEVLLCAVRRTAPRGAICCRRQDRRRSMCDDVTAGAPRAVGAKSKGPHAGIESRTIWNARPLIDWGEDAR
jgi:hypothetical protein